MAVRIANLKILVSATTAGLVAGMGKAGRSVRGFGKNVTASLGSVKGLAAGLAGLVGVTLGVRAGINTIRQQFEQLDKLGKTAAKLNTTTAAMQKFRFAAKLTGVEVQTADMALQRWVKNLSRAANGSAELAKIFTDDLQLSVEDLVGLPLEEQMIAFADALKDTVAPANRVRVIAALLDSEGVALVNTLQQGGAALDAMFKERGALGLFSEEQIRRIEDANDAMTKFGIQLDFVKGSIAAELAPNLSTLVELMVEFGNEGSSSFSFINIAIRGLVKTIAFIADGFKVVGIGIAIFLAEISAAIALLISFTDILAEKIGLSIGGPKFEAALDRFIGDTQIAVRELQEDFFGPSFLDQANDFFDEVDKRIANTRRDMLRDMLVPPTPEPGAGGLSVLLPQARLAGSAAAATFSALDRARGGTGIAAVVAGGKERLAVMREMARDMADIADQGPAVLDPAVL